MKADRGASNDAGEPNHSGRIAAAAQIEHRAAHNGAPLGIAIAGLGRSGWNIHARTLRAMPDRFRVVAAMDPDETRRDQAAAELGCRTTAEFDELLAMPGVDVVVIASPNHLHAEHALATIAAGKHAIVEKPFSMCADEAQQMIDAASGTGLVLAPFQNRRYEPHYRKVIELIDSGVLGDVLQIRMCWHRFTRRWDWQAVRRYGGGALYNNGTHLIDQAMPLLGDAEPEIFLDLRRGLSMGDADEHLKLVLRAPNGPTIDIEYTNACAFEHDRWHIMGTAGGLRGTTDTLKWRTVDWDQMPPRELQLGPAADRLYPSEDIAWTDHEWTHPLDTRETYALLYLDVYDAVRYGRPLHVTPESALRYMRLLDRCRDMIAETV